MEANPNQRTFQRLGCSIVERLCVRMLLCAVISIGQSMLLCVGLRTPLAATFRTPTSRIYPLQVGTATTALDIAFMTFGLAARDADWEATSKLKNQRWKSDL